MKKSLAILLLILILPITLSACQADEARVGDWQAMEEAFFHLEEFHFTYTVTVNLLDDTTAGETTIFLEGVASAEQKALEANVLLTRNRGNPLQSGLIAVEETLHLDIAFLFQYMVSGILTSEGLGFVTILVEDMMGDMPMQLPSDRFESAEAFRSEALFHLTPNLFSDEFLAERLVRNGDVLTVRVSGEAARPYIEAMLRSIGGSVAESFLGISGFDANTSLDGLDLTAASLELAYGPAYRSHVWVLIPDHLDLRAVSALTPLNVSPIAPPEWLFSAADLIPLERQIFDLILFLTDPLFPLFGDLDALQEVLAYLDIDFGFDPADDFEVLRDLPALTLFDHDLTGSIPLGNAALVDPSGNVHTVIGPAEDDLEQIEFLDFPGIRYAGYIFGLNIFYVFLSDTNAVDAAQEDARSIITHHLEQFDVVHITASPLRISPDGQTAMITVGARGGAEAVLPSLSIVIAQNIPGSDYVLLVEIIARGSTPHFPRDTRTQLRALDELSEHIGVDLAPYFSAFLETLVWEQ